MVRGHNQILSLLSQKNADEVPTLPLFQPWPGSEGRCKDAEHQSTCGVWGASIADGKFYVVGLVAIRPSYMLSWSVKYTAGRNRNEVGRGG